MIIFANNGYGSNQDDSSKLASCKNPFADSNIVHRKKIFIITSTGPFRMRAWEDEVDTDVDVSAFNTLLKSAKVGGWMAAEVSYNLKKQRIISILSLKMLPPRAERLYDGDQLKREMAQLDKITPDDI